MKSFLAFLLLISSAIAHPQLAYSQSDAKKQNYKLTIKSTLAMKLDAGTQNIVGDTSLEYYHLTTPENLTVGVNKLATKVMQNGKLLLDITQTVDSLIDGNTTIKIEDANDQLKTLLNDSFGSPLSKFQMDKNGVLTQRKVIAKPGAASLTNNGQIENLVFFHPPFFEDKKEWNAPAKFSIGNGNFATGDLSYKVKSTKEDKVTVQVTGNLKPAGKQAMFTIVDGKGDVSGTQIYDLKAKQWDSADIKLDIKFGLATQGKTMVQTNGEMAVALKPLASKNDKTTSNKEAQPIDQGSSKKE